MTERQLALNIAENLKSLTESIQDLIDKCLINKSELLKDTQTLKKDKDTKFLKRNEEINEKRKDERKNTEILDKGGDTK
ncbi:MAG: hypothetical protein LBK29_04290 [Oscillospiraceae bacterium]|jgi:hypothetical protein|nr:hypothetical protein [Oscillospiraceae bacterium]